MRVWLAKVPRKGGVGLIPTDEEGARILQRMADGECAEFILSRARSVQWNRMYWGLCREIGENQDPQRSEESIDSELRVRAGHYEVMFVDGHEVRVPKRIAFDKLTYDQWAELWLSIELAISERFGSEFLSQVHAA